MSIYTTILVSGIVSLIVSLSAQEFRARRERTLDESERVDRWEQDARKVLDDVEKYLLVRYTSHSIDTEELVNRVQKFSDELRDVSNEIPEAGGEKRAKDLRYLSGVLDAFSTIWESAEASYDADDPSKLIGVFERSMEMMDFEMEGLEEIEDTFEELHELDEDAWSGAMDELQRMMISTLLEAVQEIDERF